MKFIVHAARIDTFTKVFEAEDKASAEALADTELADKCIGEDEGWQLKDFEQELRSVRPVDDPFTK